MQKTTLYISLPVILLFAALTTFSQPGTTIELKKPDKYETRTLGSEKTGQKKFTYPKHLYQNTVTHYNYYFNANNKIQEIIGAAKLSFRDDYTKLLPFYNYSLEVTAANEQIDSVIYKCNAGILLHDLRNDWIDNLYLLLGEAYFLRKNFDSADQVFRYVNYAFAPKEEGGYDIPVGSNASKTDGVFTISTKENNSLTQRIFSTPPSRNESLLWQAHNYIETENYGEAAGILQILQNDAVFPERLEPQLNELLAYWYYRQHLYDSSATHLSKALEVADSKQEKARMEFLIAQLYNEIDSTDKTIFWYNKAASETLDPVMEVYANLNAIRATSGKSDDVMKEKLDNLEKMAKRDKYVGYRDIIYYAIAQVYVDMKNDSAASVKLKKSIYYNTPENPEQKSKSFLLLADINYNEGNYVDAKNFYDSVEVSSLTDSTAGQRITERLEALDVIAGDIKTINREDSLQHIASLSKDDRDAAIKKMVRTLRKQQGLKDEPEVNVNPAVQQQTQPNLFGSAASSSSDWYFNNFQLKSTGFNQFRATWGSRPNVDNWRRQAALKAATASDNEENNDEDEDSTTGEDETVKAGSDTLQITDENGDITYESVAANLPLTTEQVQSSNEKIADALFKNGEVFMNKLEDYPAAIKAFEELLKRFPENKNREQTLFDLFYCYSQTGNKSAANDMRAALNKEFPKGDLTKKIADGGKTITTTAANDPVTERYKQIYNLFIGGDFEQAKEEKQKADSIYGNTYWTPQLLYIEAIYYVTAKEDSIAIDKLTNLQGMYAQSPLAEKAATMIDVLKRRTEIETYLTNLQIKRYEEDQAPIVDLTPPKPVVEKVVIKQDSTVNKTITQVAKSVDTTRSVAPVIRTYSFDAKDSQYVAILLDKVAPVFVNEAKNAFTRYNKTTFYNQKLSINPAPIDDRYNLVLIGPFSDAAAASDYIDKVKPVTSSRIIPWLTPDKYAYTIISQGNLDIMKETKDVDSYKKLLNTIFPGKF